MASSTWQTPPKAAKEIGVNAEKIIGWITRGELVAVNVADRTTDRLAREIIMAVQDAAIDRVTEGEP